MGFGELCPIPPNLELELVIDARSVAGKPPLYVLSLREESPLRRAARQHPGYSCWYESWGQDLSAVIGGFEIFSSEM